MSYASVVSVDIVEVGLKGRDAKDSIIEIQSGDFVASDKDANLACFEKAWTFSTLSNLEMLCMDEGSDNINLCYVDGL